MQLTTNEIQALLSSGYTIRVSWIKNNTQHVQFFTDLIMANSYTHQLSYQYVTDITLECYPDYRIKEDYNESYWMSVPIV